MLAREKLSVYINISAILKTIRKYDIFFSKFTREKKKKDQEQSNYKAHLLLMTNTLN